MIEMLKTKILENFLNRRPTMLVSKDKNIELSKYKHVEDVTGDRLNVQIKLFLTPPVGMTINDWIITNLVDFLQRIELLYSSCSLFCTSDTCPLFNAGPKYIYFWLDDDSKNPIQISAPEYFYALKHFIKRNLTNPYLFPNDSTENFSPRADYIIKASYRRLFRVLAHLYICHFKDFSKLAKDNFNFFEIMNTILIHYSNIAINYKICQPEEFDVFKPIFKKINIHTHRSENTDPNFHSPILTKKLKPKSVQ